ncbi:nascent polypeptide-associated complex subunit alpha, muscle-specific form [Anopheles maculipalpis]|uniref:nascent polypeptide-associated complex subunit alpha, muscle-specific form n=1 Tax=Anopheles maculipalpis TaxID=1496333 RepID=UPI0021590AA4|nr:nascent polypeptide-associated complex subunit alpha, muscle-specific form [Anopheles maculipalpis]
MSQEYAQHVLKVAVAQICRTIGWHSTHASTMDLLIDVTQHFLREISRTMHRYCELYNRTEANLDDLALAYKEIGINLDELMEYVQFVDPIPLPLEVPRFPLPKESNLNFLKPGSREVLTRPVHIPEYMPPLMLEAEEDGSTERSENESEKRSFLNNAALAIAATVAATMSSEARALTDRGEDESGMSSDAKGGPETTGVEEVPSTGEGVDDGSGLPHVVINEEVEIPMQTIELKEPSASGGDEESAASVSKRPEIAVVKDKPTQPDETSTPVGTKPVLTAEEGRPTREISSVIMTTSGFISPAREGKLPESRIPIIPEERPIQQPSPVVPTVSPTLTTASHLPTGTALPSVPASVPSLAGAGPVSSVALLASAAGGYFPKPTTSDGIAGGIAGLPAAVGATGTATSGVPSDTTSPLVPPMKPPGGEKPIKKVKKKPTDREKKKTNTSKKPDKQHAPGEKGTATMAKLSVPLDVPFGAMITKEQTDFTTPLPPVPDALATGRLPENLAGLSNPFVKNGNLGMEANEATKPIDSSLQPGGVGLNVPPNLSTGKPSKPAKVKNPKEKPVKKRKSATPKPRPVPAPGEMVIDDPALLNRPPLPLQNFLPFPKLPKPKKAPKASKKAAAQRMQFDAEQPPPLIPGPLGLGSASFSGPIKSSISMSDSGYYGLSPSSSTGGIGPSTTAGILVPLKKPPLMGPFKQEDASESQQPFIDQATQLNMLQKMHPSLEITASPSFSSSQEDVEKPLTPGRMLFEGGRGMKPDTTTSERDVIVIDDDKSPPHVSAVSSTMMTPPTTKKQRKQLAHSNVNTPPGMGFQGVTVPYAAGPDGEFRPDETSHYSPLSYGIPKTPDIRLQSSSASSTTSTWLPATPKKAAVTGNLFSELASKTPDEAARLTLPGGTGAGGAGASGEGGKKPKRPKQKPKPDSKAMAKLAEANKKLDEAVAAVQKFGNPIPGSGHPNPFSLYPGSLNPFAPDASMYSKYLNQSLQTVPGLRNPMPFGMFPLPSGPGLIPDNPLFPRLPPTYPGQPRGPGGFQLPPNPFGLPGINPMNLLRMPGLANRMPGGPGGSQRDFLDEPLDPETKLAQTPLDLQKSTCNVAPLVPPSLFQSATEGMALGSTNDLLNLSVSKSTTTASPSKDTVTTTQTTSTSKKEPPVAASVAASGAGVGGSIFSTTGVTSTVKDSYKEDQVVILPAASVLPGASPPQRSSMLVVDVEDSDDGSQSTVGGKSKDGKRKQKEHKKDRKLKDGKIKKKKDKKDKSKSKDREREQQLKELTAGTATSPGVMTMGMIGAEEALMEQLRKERKEKKEKRKEKIKKEKRKEKERGMVATGSGAGVGQISSSSVGSTGAGQPSGDIVPKLMLKIGGSNATQSPRSETPDQQLFGASAAAAMSDPKRDVSPELARISALVTRPPKLKAVGSGSAAGSSKSKKDEAGKNVPPMGSPLSGLAGTEPSKPHHGLDGDDTFGAGKQSGKANLPATSAVSSSTSGYAQYTNYATTDDSPTGAGSSTSRGSKVARLADSAADSTVKPFAGGESSKKATKESSKGSKSVHHHHHHHASQVDTYTTTPAHMTDVDGNTVWICPACGRVDDGTPMIGCDGCDAWYHWVCVGIQVPPEDNEDWYCRVCIAKKQDSHADEKQRKRKKKDKKTSKD